MGRCEDYPCCGHGPPPMGDGGGCPDIDSQGRERWRCVTCGRRLPARASSSICRRCLGRMDREGWPDEPDQVVDEYDRW